MIQGKTRNPESQVKGLLLKEGPQGEVTEIGQPEKALIWAGGESVLFGRVFLTFFERVVYVFLSYWPVRVFNVFYTFFIRFCYVFLTFLMADPVRGPKASNMLQMNTFWRVCSRGNQCCQKGDFLALSPHRCFLRFSCVFRTFWAPGPATFFLRFSWATPGNQKPKKNPHRFFFNTKYIYIYIYIYMYLHPRADFPLFKLMYRCKAPSCAMWQQAFAFPRRACRFPREVCIFVRSYQ